MEFIYGGRACVAWQCLGPSRIGTRTTEIKYEWPFTALRLAQTIVSEQSRAKNAAMQARAYPAHLPGRGPLPGLVGTGRGGLFPSGSLGRRAPAGRGGATIVCAVDGASVAAAASAAADSPLPPAQVTWQIVVGAVGRSVYLFPRSSELRIASSTSSVV